MGGGGEGGWKKKLPPNPFTCNYQSHKNHRAAGQFPLHTIHYGIGTNMKPGPFGIHFSFLFFSFFFFFWRYKAYQNIFVRQVS